MNSIFLYIAQTTIVFSIFYILYVLLLNKLTFHSANRFVLLLVLPISVIIPFLDTIFPTISAKIVEVPLFEHITFDMDAPVDVIEQPLITSSFNYAILLMAIYWIVWLLYIIRILNTARQLYVLKRKALVDQKNGYQLIFTQVPEIFSYFNCIFIPEHQLEPYDKEILEHEKAHIRLKHSWDIILIELYIAFFWFNPLLYFYRKSLKSVHEFQADKGVLQKGVKTSDYMRLLLESLEVRKPNNLYNYFNQSILKKRVNMMTKSKSNHISKLKYTLFLPICVYLISAFTSPNTILDNEYLEIVNVSKSITSPPSLFPVKNGTKENITSLFGVKRNHPKIKKKVAHTGIDIKATPGTPVIATADGIIAKAQMKGDWGNLIVITHSDGYETWYAHLKGFNTKENQTVKKGDVIGYVGNTGLSTGAHLHYEVKQNGKHLNPLAYIE